MVTHLKCLPDYSDSDFEYINTPTLNWSCPTCLSDHFPFTSIEDIQEFTELLAPPIGINYSLLDELIINPYEMVGEEGFLDDIDPDGNFYNNPTLQPPKTQYLTTDAFNKITKDPHKPHHFSTLHTNIRSTKKNFDDLNILLSFLTHKFTIVALTETWLKPHNVDLFPIDNYNHEYSIRQLKPGGGISLYIKDTIDYHIRTDLNHSDDELDMIWLELDKRTTGTTKNILYGCIYRRPDTDIKVFNDRLLSVMDIIRHENKFIYHVGDYNIDLLKHQTHLPTNDFININFANTLSPFINKPTRITEHSASLIDNIFSNTPSSFNDISGIIPSDISDHFPIFNIHYTDSPANIPPMRKKRDYSDKNIQKFNHLISQVDWTTVTNQQDAQESYTVMHNKIAAIVEEVFPYKNIKSNYSTRLSWLTLSHKNAIKRRHQLYIIYKKTPTKENHINYKQYRNILKRVLRDCERSHYQELLTSNQHNLRKSWQVIKEVINRKKTCSQKTTIFMINGMPTEDPALIANLFNNFFTNIGPVLDKKIPKSQLDPSSFIKNTCPSSIFLTPCTQEEISKITDNLKNCATGWDNLPSSVIKCNKNVFSPLLAHVINLSLCQGIFPKELKLGNIIPILKSGKINEVTNYRPISLLTTLSKIYERVFCNRLLSFLNKNKILYDLQFGFRDSHSTYLAMLSLMEKIIGALEKGELTIGIFLDFSKAFDTVNHKILLTKLYSYGIRGMAYTWIESYLTNRKQFTSYNGSNSPTATIKCGVPQGSILGPILFLLYINDLGSISNLLSPIMFADDSNLFMSGKNLPNLSTLLNNEIPILVEWLRANRLSLNIGKTHAMIFGKTKKQAYPEPNIYIDGTRLDIVTSTKFLGVILDSELSWKTHINHLSKKIAKSIGIISLARRNLHRKTLIQLYHAFIYPYLSYCVLIWGNSPASTLWPVYKLQKLALRIIMCVGPRVSSLPFCKEHCILRLPEIYTLNAGIFMFKFKNSQLPDIFNNLFIRNDAIHRYPTRNASHLRAPRTKSRIAESFITNTGVHIWNSFSNILNTETKLGTFKRALKKFLSQKY
jgi:hypothetical protein